MPIILVHRAFWAGLLDWFRERLVAEHMIGAEDPDLIQVIDEPAAVVEAIFKYYEKRGFAPLPSEKETLLNL
jgi:predicted Rossmann-fold nucleotide-binding protein